MSSSSSYKESTPAPVGSSSSAAASWNIGSSSSNSGSAPVAPLIASKGSSSSYFAPVVPIGSSSSSLRAGSTGTSNTSLNINISELQTNYDSLTSFANTGLSSVINTITADATSSANKTLLDNKLAEFRAFNNSLRTQVSALSKDIDIGRRTQMLGELRARIQKLEKLEATAREEAETAESRLKYVEKREQDVSYKQLFFLERPVRQFSVPTFVTLSVLFALLTIRFIYMIYAGVETGPVSVSYLTGVGAAPAANTSGLGALFGYGQQAAAPGLGGLFSSSGITGQLR